MKVIFYLDDLKSGGVQRRTLRLISGLIKYSNRSDFSLNLIVRDASGDLFDLIDEKVTLRVLGTKSIFSTILALIKNIRIIKPDVIVSCMGQQFIQTILAKFLLRFKFSTVVIQAVPVKLTDCSALLNLSRILSISIFYNLANKVTAVSKDVYESLINDTFVRPKCIELVHNPVVDEKLFELALEIPKRYEFSSNIPTIVSLGRLHYQKNFSCLIEAFNLFLSYNGNAKLVLIGDGPDYFDLKCKCQDLGIQDSVVFLGFVENPFPYLSRANLFVMSSRWEGLPNALIEALALGVKCVSTDCIAGPREILEDGRYGSLVSVNNPELLAEAMIEEFNMERSKESLTARGSEFSVEKSSRKYMSIFVDERIKNN